MKDLPPPSPAPRASRLLQRLARDRSGNTLAMVAAAVLPLLGIIGGGVDMGRSYLAQARLQNACDAGVLAARKRLGTGSAVTGTVPSDVAQIGQRFFNINYRSGIYGTENREFAMTLESDYEISGAASVDVPTTVMSVFGFQNVPVKVECGAKLNFSELDVMMVLDVTGSMRHTNAGDTLSRIDSLKQVIRNFHTQLESSKAAGTAIRYGFVPYATNVNVGHLLEDEWVANQWTYQSREDTGRNKITVNQQYTRNWQYVSGSRSAWTTTSTYQGTYHAPASADQLGYYSCDQGQPASSWSYVDEVLSERTEFTLNPPAILYIKDTRRTHNGTRYQTIVNGSQCEVQSSTDTNYVQTFEDVTEVPSIEDPIWHYKPIEYDVSDWRTATDGCIEERKTTMITDYDNVDLSQNLDLDIDLVPTPGDPETQWRPHYPGKIYVRAIDTFGGGSISVPDVTTADLYADTGNWWFSDCPAKAQKLQEMTAEQLDTYLATLTPYGATYHDIGMIWGARLISPTGLFASENGASDGSARKSRHMIFLTDGQTEPYDIAYSSYGVDALDQRRWNPGSSMTLAQTVEARFKFACLEAKKRNVTMWVIAFGTRVNQAMVDCAGAGHYFEATNAVQLNNAFTTIAKSIGDLRISR